MRKNSLKYISHPHQGNGSGLRIFSFVPMAKTTDIRAIRDGKINHFHPNTWANMPEDKYGWQEIRQASAPPPVVVEAMTAAKPAGMPIGTAIETQTKKPRGKRAK